ncbi:MAG: hypothetical protein K8963_09805, partial [Proteobacteria bacterium]|nr:hypothetical protein [Pseudomonadota bacterium]
MTIQSPSQNVATKPVGQYDGFEIGSVIRVWWFHRRLIMIVTALVVLTSVLTVGRQEKLFASIALIRIHYAPEDIVRAA